MTALEILIFSCSVYTTYIISYFVLELVITSTTYIYIYVCVCVCVCINTMMFSKNVKTTLLRGPKMLSKSFMFEAATYWAEEGQRVVYITPVPLDKRPAVCHDRRNPAVSALKLMRFIYLSDYEALMEQLFKLHTYAAVPSVFLIDDLHDYLQDNNPSNDEDSRTRIAKICASIIHSIKSCSRILRKNVHVCAWDSSNLINNLVIQTMYFHNIWNLTEKEDGNVISVKRFSVKSSLEQSYTYYRFQDGTRVLQQILCDSMEV